MKSFTDKVDEFLADPTINNAWLYSSYGAVYVRKSNRWFTGCSCNTCFDIANINIKPNKQGKGFFTNLVNHLLDKAPTDYLCVENVLDNPRFCDYLVRTGWDRVALGGIPSFFMKVNK